MNWCRRQVDTIFNQTGDADNYSNDTIFNENGDVDNNSNDTLAEGTKLPDMYTPTIMAEQTW